MSQEAIRLQFSMCRACITMYVTLHMNGEETEGEQSTPDRKRANRSLHRYSRCMFPSLNVAV